ncbi:MAG: hypothetical protein R3Y26_05290 [Rikenellaceae bacterium]
MEKKRIKNKSVVLIAFCASGKNYDKTASDFGYSSSTIRNWWKAATDEEKSVYQQRADSLISDTCEQPSQQMEPTKTVTKEPESIAGKQEYVGSLYDIRDKIIFTINEMLLDPALYKVTLSQVATTLKEINLAIKGVVEKEEAEEENLNKSLFENIIDTITV